MKYQEITERSTKFNKGDIIIYKDDEYLVVDGIAGEIIAEFDWTQNIRYVLRPIESGAVIVVPFVEKTVNLAFVDGDGNVIVNPHIADEEPLATEWTAVMLPNETHDV